jgi:hypothetical protein
MTNRYVNQKNIKCIIETRMCIEQQKAQAHKTWMALHVSGWQKFHSVRIPCQELTLCSPTVPVRSPLLPSLLRVKCETKTVSERIRTKRHESTVIICPGTIVSPKMCKGGFGRIPFLRNCLSWTWRPVLESKNRRFPSRPVIAERWWFLPSRLRTLLLRTVILSGSWYYSPQVVPFYLYLSLYLLCIINKNPHLLSIRVKTPVIYFPAEIRNPTLSGILTLWGSFTSSTI